MNALKGLYTWTLVTLLILAGCLGTGVINDTEGQSSDDSNSTDDSNSSDNTDDSNSSDQPSDDSSSSDNVDNDNFNDNETNENDDNDNWNDNITNDDDDWDEDEDILDYQQQFGSFAIGGTISANYPVYTDVATINTTRHTNYDNDSWNMVLVHIHEIHVDSELATVHSMNISSSCNNGNVNFDFEIQGNFPADERYLGYLPGGAFDCIHTISIISNNGPIGNSNVMSWSLVYSITNEPLFY